MTMPMKIAFRVFLFLSPLLTIGLSAQTPVILSDVRQPHQIAVDGNDLYVFDEADYSLHAYSLSPFAPKWQFGRKGDGPREFKYLPTVYVQPESLACTDFTKMVRLSKRGEALEAWEFSRLKDFDLNSEMLLIPVKDGFVRITASHDQMKRRVFLLDAHWQTLKHLYEGPFVWQAGSATDVRTDTLISQGLVFVADTSTFRITIFDDKGNLLRTIDKSKDVEEIPGRAKLHQYCVSEGKIYATTYKEKDNQREMIILDLKGDILKRLTLPLASIRANRGVLRYDLFTVSSDKLYELVRDNQTEKWELRATALNSSQK